MEKVMLKPEKGQIIKSAELGISGVVTDILSYGEVFDWMPQSQLEQENARLANLIGADFKEKYFEACIDVIEAEEGSEYRAGDPAILNWEEVQNCQVESA